MPYIKTYDHLFNESFQCEISEETAMKLKAVNIKEYNENVKAEPWPHLDIKSRYRSIRHPGWDKESE